MTSNGNGLLRRMLATFKLLSLDAADNMVAYYDEIKDAAWMS